MTTQTVSLGLTLNQRRYHRRQALLIKLAKNRPE